MVSKVLPDQEATVAAAVETAAIIASKSPVAVAGMLQTAQPSHAVRAQRLAQALAYYVASTSNRARCLIGPALHADMHCTCMCLFKHAYIHR